MPGCLPPPGALNYFNFERTSHQSLGPSRSAPALEVPGERGQLERGGAAGEAAERRQARGSAAPPPAPLTAPCRHRRRPAPTHVFRGRSSTHRQACTGRRGAGRAPVTPASGEPRPGVPRSVPARGSPARQPSPNPLLFRSLRNCRVPLPHPCRRRKGGGPDGGPAVPTPQRPPLNPAESLRARPPGAPPHRGRSAGPSPLLPSESLERGGPGHPRFFQAGPVAGLHGVGGSVHGLAVEVSLRVGVAAVPDASPGQAAAPRDGRRRRLPGVLLVLEELVLPQLRWVVLILPPQMLGGFETPAAVAAAVAAAAAGHRGQAAAALCLHAAGAGAAPGGQGRWLPPASLRAAARNCAEKLDSSSRATPRPSVGAAGAAAPPGLDCSAGGEAGRGGGGEGGEEGLASRSEIFKAGLERGLGRADPAGDCGDGAEDAGLCGRWERARRRCRQGAGVGMGPGVNVEGFGAADAAASSPEAPLSLPEAGAAGRTGSPPEGVSLPGDGRWQSCSRLCSPRTLRWVKNGFSLLKLPLSPSPIPYIVFPQSTSGSEIVFPQLETFPWSCLRR